MSLFIAYLFLKQKSIDKVKLNSFRQCLMTAVYSIHSVNNFKMIKIRLFVLYMFCVFYDQLKICLLVFVVVFKQSVKSEIPVS